MRGDRMIRDVWIWAVGSDYATHDAVSIEKAVAVAHSAFGTSARIDAQFGVPKPFEIKGFKNLFVRVIER